MQISALYTYPVKSCGRLSHAEIELDARGPVWDRRWMVVDSEGKFLTQRELPPMALIQPAFQGAELSVNAPGMPEMCIPLEPDRLVACQIQVWNDFCKAWDEGNHIATWVSDYLKVNARLVRIADDFVRPLDMRYARRPGQTGFADGFPLLIASEESLAELNRHLIGRGKEAVPMHRFRPNIVIAGGEPFAEDTWSTVQMGEVLIDVVKSCARCVMTTVDPATGTILDVAEPLATLNTFRKQNGKVMFAQNAVHQSSGVLHVGDAVTVTELKIE